MEEGDLNIPTLRLQKNNKELENGDMAHKNNWDTGMLQYNAAARGEKNNAMQKNLMQ